MFWNMWLLTDNHYASVHVVFAMPSKLDHKESIPWYYEKDSCCFSSAVWCYCVWVLWLSRRCGRKSYFSKDEVEFNCLSLSFHPLWLLVPCFLFTRMITWYSETGRFNVCTVNLMKTDLWCCILLVLMKAGLLLSLLFVFFMTVLDCRWSYLQRKVQYKIIVEVAVAILPFCGKSSAFVYN